MIKNKKLNAFTLSGLIIGPILGSGIILLPPLLYDKISAYSLIVWIVILILGFAFALVFGRLAILFPGDGGVSLATKEALGKKYQLLTSFYLICAVLFGPVAVLLVAAGFVSVYFPHLSIVALSFFIYLITYVMLLIKIDFLGRLMLIVTSSVTVIFLISSINILLNVDSFTLTFPHVEIKEIGYSFLLVFWAIVGWEVIGNYSNEVKNTKTLTNAVVFSAIVVSLVYILVALAVCFGDFPLRGLQSFKLVWLIEPIFKSYSAIILSSISLVLCIGTIILFVGGVARLISSLKLSKYTSKHLKNGSPIGALNFLSLDTILVLFLVYTKVLTLSNIVAISDGFFISNAIIGLITAIILFRNGFLRYSAIVLSVIFFSILLFSNILILFIVTGLFLFIYFKK
jgi:APA family basic amino acid/polyamine antiporter